MIHYDSVQTFYRIMTSTVMLATFAAIGFCLSTKDPAVFFGRLLVVMYLCLISITAITILWRLDLIFTERLFLGNFFNAVLLEKENPWLPKVHLNMIKGTSHHGAPARKVWFYIGSAVSLFIVFGIATFFYLKTCMYINPFIIFGADLILLVLYSYIVLKKTENFEISRIKISRFHNGGTHG